MTDDILVILFQGANNKKYLQIHQIKSVESYPLISTIDVNVISFDVILIESIYYVFAV